MKRHIRRHLKIYLAGKMGGLSYEDMNKWRVELTNKFLFISQDMNYDLWVINPVNFYNFEEQRHQSEKEIKEYDLAHVITSDIVIVNLDGLSSSDGTKIELHDANYNHKIPVIAFGRRELYDNLHPWIKDNITRVENNMNDVVEYIKEFYMI